MTRSRISHPFLPLAAFLAIALTWTALPSTVRAQAQRVNLNTATAAQLDALPGIGKATADRIVDYRQKNGGFKKIEDLMNVKGIGEKSFLKLKPLISVAGEKADRAGGEAL